MQVVRGSATGFSTPYVYLTFPCTSTWSSGARLKNKIFLTSLYKVSSVIDFLKRCQARDGGFGGGPGQLAHLAPTYAAVLALCTIGTEEAYNAIDRYRRTLFI